MAITFKKNDELEKMMENFAKPPEGLEKVEFPDDKEKKADKKVKK